jgi:type IV fimbrial biogenesis protein FimT
MNLNPQRAFTLVELMITLALLAILASVAVPAFAELIARNRQLALQDEMLAALNYTRAQAVLSNSVVELRAIGSWRCSTKYSTP